MDRSRHSPVEEKRLRNRLLKAKLPQQPVDAVRLDEDIKQQLGAC
jgi:hypothetical protein